MKQVSQNLKNGETVVGGLPCPRTPHGHLLIRTACTLVSTGTERMLVDFGNVNLIDKARQQPDKVKEVIDKVRTDGLAPTVRAVRHKLDHPLPMGYCKVGVAVHATQTNSEPMPGRSPQLRQSAPTHDNRRPMIDTMRAFESTIRQARILNLRDV